MGQLVSPWLGKVAAVNTYRLKDATGIVTVNISDTRECTLWLSTIVVGVLRMARFCVRLRPFRGV